MSSSALCTNVKRFFVDKCDFVIQCVVSAEFYYVTGSLFLLSLSSRFQFIFLNQLVPAERTLFQRKWIAYNVILY